MHKRWINTHVATATEMVDITDETIQEFSNGEVIFPAPCDEKDPVQGTMTDPTIFGKPEDEEPLMGHIVLPVPIVNIQYLFGSNPILPRILGISRKNIEQIVYHGSYVVISPKETRVSYKQVLDKMEYKEFKANHPNTVCMSGAMAIDALLKIENIEERKHIILHTIPVIPICLRYVNSDYKDNEHMWIPRPLEQLYDRLLKSINRLKSMEMSKAPLPVLQDECKILQRHADRLINNGAHDLPYLLPSGHPAQSLQEFYEVFSTLHHDVSRPVIPTFDPVDAKELKKPLQILYPAHVDLENEFTDMGDVLERILEGDYTYDPKSFPQNKAREEILMLFHSFIKAVILENFSLYADDYFDKMQEFAEESIIAGLENIDLNDEPIELQLLGGVFDTIKLTLKKQSIYL